MSDHGHILALAGGVGGAKLASGLAAVLAPEALTIVVNTGDDFEHLGLRVSPDIDSVVYALAGLNDPVRGWGLADESWNAMRAVARLGGPDWFALGDQDLATHLLRTEHLRKETLSQVTADFARRLGIAHCIGPMSDDRVRSVIETDVGSLPFQDYFVRHRCSPRFLGIRFDGIDSARPAPGFDAVLDDSDLRAVVLCPSNPLLSLRPILSLPGVSERLWQRRVPVVAVSPFVGGEAVKGPAAKILRELGLPVTPEGLLACYDDFNGVPRIPAAAADSLAQTRATLATKKKHRLIDALVVDRSDADFAARSGATAVHVTDTLMHSVDDQARLAREVLAFVQRLRAGPAVT